MCIPPSGVGSILAPADLVGLSPRSRRDGGVKPMEEGIFRVKNGKLTASLQLRSKAHLVDVPVSHDQEDSFRVPLLEANELPGQPALWEKPRRIIACRV